MMNMVKLGLPVSHLMHENFKASCRTSSKEALKITPLSSELTNPTYSVNSRSFVSLQDKSPEVCSQYISLFLPMAEKSHREKNKQEGVA